PELDLPDAAEPDDEIDAWITWNPAPQVANFAHSQRGVPAVWGEPVPLGSAPEGVLISGTDDAALRRRCQEGLTWPCLAGSVDDLTVGVGDPASAEGLARLAPFASALAEGDDPATLDVGALDRVVRSPATGQ